MAGRIKTALVAVLVMVAGCSDESTGPARGGPDSADRTATATATAPAPARVAVARPAGPERLVLAFGDSLYAGYGLARGEGLAPRLEDALRRAGVNATVVDAGVSGDTTAAGRQRLAFSLDHLPRRPDLVLLGLGGNDALRQLPPSETRANLAAMLDTLQAQGVPVVLTGMRAPPNLGPDFAARFEPIWPELAQAHHAALYPFILDGVITDPALMQPDGLHPTARGVGRIVDRLAPLVQRELETRAP